MMGIFETRASEGQGRGEEEGMVVVVEEEDGGKASVGSSSVPNVRVAVLAVNTQVRKKKRMSICAWVLW